MTLSFKAACQIGLLLGGLHLGAAALPAGAPPGKDVFQEFVSALELPPAQGRARLLREMGSSDFYRHSLATTFLYGDVERFALDAKMRGQLRVALLEIYRSDQPEWLRNDALSLYLATAWPGRDEFYRENIIHRVLKEAAWVEPAAADPERWAPYLLERLAGSEPARSNAARILAQLGREKVHWKSPQLRHQIVTALLPWLHNAEWVRQADRQRLTYVQWLARVKLPEARAGLIALVETGDRELAEAAARALFQNPTPEAAAALARRYPGDSPSREVFLALSRCDGYSPRQGVADLEAYTRKFLRDRAGPERTWNEKQQPDEQRGLWIARRDALGDSTIPILMERIDTLREKEPKVALGLERVLFSSQRPQALAYAIDRLEDEDLDASLVRMAVDERKSLQRHSSPNLAQRLARSRGAARARYAVIAEDSAAIEQILSGEDTGARLELLRLSQSREPLLYDFKVDTFPVFGDPSPPPRLNPDQVGPLLGEAGPVTQKAREWLEAQGGPRAWSWLDTSHAAPPEKSPDYRISGIFIGMSRAEAEARMDKETMVFYGDGERVVAVIGKQLWNGRELIVARPAKVRDVLRRMGQPEACWFQHLFLTVGGRVWKYGELSFSFVDDHGTSGLDAPLYQVRLGSLPGPFEFSACVLKNPPWK